MLRIVIRAAATLLLSVASALAQEPLETRGAWRLVADGQDFALRTQAEGAPGTTLSLYCRQVQQLYAFEIKSPALAARPRGEDIRIGYRVDDDDEAWFNLATGPDGSVPISHQTAFWIIREALIRSGAKGVAFTAADQTWRFALDGLSALTGSLTARCEFEPPRSQPDTRPSMPRPPDQ